MTADDWFKLAQQIATLITPFFLAWLALQYARLNKTVDKKAVEQTEKLDTISTAINGHMSALVEAKTAAGKLAGIAEEQARILDAAREILSDQQDAARTLTTNARTLATQVVAAAETVAARKLAAVKKPEPEK